MTIVRPFLPAFMLAIFTASPALSQDKATAATSAGSTSCAALEKEYLDASTTWSKERRAALELANKNGAEKEFSFEKPLPGPLFAPRFVAIAAKNPEGPEAVQALMMTETRTDKSVQVMSRSLFRDEG